MGSTMSSVVSVETLSGDTQYKKDIHFDTRNIQNVRDLKQILSRELGLPAARFSIVKMAEALLYEDTDPLYTEVKGPLNIIVHPESRVVFDHLKTEAKDMIMDFEEVPRTMMSCGHGIVPENLYDLCWNNLKGGVVQFECPAVDNFNVREKVQSCGAVWSLYELTVKAQLSKGERILFEMRLNKNYLREEQGIQECPVCRSVCMRQNETNNRVTCSTCNQKHPDNPDFCWKCLHPWTKTNTNEFCGNLSCFTAKGPKMSQEILDTCDKKNIDGYVNVPSVRACPKCHALVEHVQGCKRMACKCTFQFCFVCLKSWEATGCGYNKRCNNVAPCQNITAI